MTGPTPDTVDWPDDAVEVGRILDAWGVKGWLKVQPFAADPQALFSTRRWFLKPPDAALRPGASAVPALLKIMQSREHGDVVVAQVQGVEDRQAAEALRGARVFVPRASFPTPDEGEFYWVDLIGLAVVNRDGQPLGRVVGLLDTGPHSVLRVLADGADPAPEDAAERLIPFVAAYVDEVDRSSGRIVVDWGLDF